MLVFSKGSEYIVSKRKGEKGKRGA